MNEKNDNAASIVHPIRRRQALGGLAAIAAGILGLPAGVRGGAAGETGKLVASKGRINQSIVQWCFKKYWDLDGICRIAKDLGCKSVELVEPEDWPILKKHGLISALTGSHGFEKGMNDPRNHAMCAEKIRKSVDLCAEAGFPSVITFTGFREGIADDLGLENCVKGLKGVIGYCEKKKINLCLEMLNSRVAVEMKGHPGYQGDHVDYCMEIIRRVGSDRMKLLFDIYHVQIMDGDVIARIRQYKDSIGHYHVAGNPGRGELDSRQEINFRPILEEIAKTGYKGYVGQEFVPTRDPLEGLREAVAVCDV